MVREELSGEYFRGRNVQGMSYTLGLEYFSSSTKIFMSLCAHEGFSLSSGVGSLNARARRMSISAADVRHKGHLPVRHVAMATHAHLRLICPCTSADAVCRLRSPISHHLAGSLQDCTVSKLIRSDVCCNSALQ